MHSSRMRTARSSSHLQGGWVSASVHAGIHPWVWTCRPPLGVGLETPLVWAWRPPPQTRPLNFPLGVGLETPLARPLKLPPGCGPGNLQGMLGYPPWRPARHAGIHPPVNSVGVSRGYTDYHQGRAIHMADSRIH